LGAVFQFDFYRFYSAEILKYSARQEFRMTNKTGVMRVDPVRMRRFERFVFDLAAKRAQRVTHDDALDALLKEVGY
jgi:hypothetical protein